MDKVIILSMRWVQIQYFKFGLQSWGYFLLLMSGHWTRRQHAVKICGCYCQRNYCLITTRNTFSGIHTKKCQWIFVKLLTRCLVYMFRMTCHTKENLMVELYILDLDLFRFTKRSNNQNRISNGHVFFEKDWFLNSIE